MPYTDTLEVFVECYERAERNQIDLEDTRFGEIYLDDKQEENYDE